MNTQAADLQQQMAAFLASGGTVQVLPGFERVAPLPVHTAPTSKKAERTKARQTRNQLLMGMRDELRALAPTHTAQQVAAMKGIPLQTLRDFAHDQGYAFRSVLARQFTPTEIASIKALAARMNCTQAAREIGIGRKILQHLAEVEGFRFRDGREVGQTNLTLINMGEAGRRKHIERLSSFKALGLTERQALEKCGLGGRVFKALCQQASITWTA
jgi:hypothetical protein